VTEPSVLHGSGAARPACSRCGHPTRRRSLAELAGFSQDRPLHARRGGLSSHRQEHASAVTGHGVRIRPSSKGVSAEHIDYALFRIDGNLAAL
jgi:hypothetical protein